MPAKKSPKIHRVIRHPYNHALVKTQSVCPECQKVLPAEIFERDGKVWIKKTCSTHGDFEELYWGDYQMYEKARSFARDGKGVSNPNVEKDNPVCPYDCGLCKMHKSHTALANIVVTNRCDLACWYCLPYEEEIPVRIGGKMQTRKIGELTEFWLSKNKGKTRMGEFSVPESLEVLTYENGKCVWTKVKKLFKRKYEGRFVEVTTATGRTVRTTEDHRFMIFNGENILKKKISEKMGNERILSSNTIPSGNEITEIDLLEGFRNLPEHEMEKIFVRNIGPILEHLKKDVGLKAIFLNAGIESDNIYSWKQRGGMPLPEFYKLNYSFDIKPNGVSFGVDGKQYSVERKLKITPEIAKLIGYFIADGHYAKQNIWFTCGDEFVRKDITGCLEKLGLNYSILEYKKQKKAPQVVVGNKLLALAFRHVLGIPSGARNKRLPLQSMQFGNEEKVALLTGLFNGDGYVVRGENHASIGLGSVSPNLIKDTAYLLQSLSIYPRVHSVSMKNNRLANYDLQKLYIGSENMLKLLETIELKPSHMKRLENLSKRKKSMISVHGDFIVDDVKEIRVMDSSGPTEVYDLEVESDSHSFIAGGGILISNCFYYAQKMGYVYEPTLEQIRFMVKNLVSEKPVPCNAVQLTGGEPTMRKDLIEIIKICKEEGIDHVQLNTNGIRLSQSPSLAMRVREAGVNALYMSFDGVTEKTNPKNHWEVPKAMENCKKAGIGIVLVPTVIKGVNDHELGDILRFGFKNNDVIRGVNYQPVSLVGRMPKKERDNFRITIPDAIKRIEEQTGGEVSREDFYPVPSVMPITNFVEAITKKQKYSLSTHFSCGMATYVFNDNGKMLPITRFVDVEGLFRYLDTLADDIRRGKNRYRAGLNLMFKLNSFIDKQKQPKGFSLSKIIYNALMKHDYSALGEFHHKSLFVGMMHFMDQYNYDVERVKRCCIHYATPDPKMPIVPFCAFNVMPDMYREPTQKKFSLPIPKWEEKTGRKLKDDFYRRK